MCMQSSLELQLKAFINNMILKKENPVFQDRDILRRTCSAVLFKGLSSGAVVVAQKHESQTIKGITKNQENIVIDLNNFPELNENDGFLWIPESDMVVMNVPGVGYRAFSSLCPVAKNKEHNEDLRCNQTKEWAFEINSCNNETPHLHPLKISYHEQELSISLSASDYSC